MIRRLLNFLFGKKPTPFLNHIAALFPDKKDQETLLRFMANIVQFPTQRYGRALVLVAPKASGKDILLSVLRSSVPDNAITVTDYQSLFSRFNYPLANKSLVLVQCGSRIADTLDKIKPLVSSHEMEFSIKGKDRELGATPTNIIVIGDGLFEDELNDADTRRFHYVISPHTSAQKVAVAGSDTLTFALWMATKGNMELVADFLRKYPL